MTLVVGVPKVLNSSGAFTAGSPKFTKFGASVPTALLVKSIRQRKYMSALRLPYTQYSAENGYRIPVIGQTFINGSVELLVIPADNWGCGLPFIQNVQAPSDPKGWGHGGTYNQN